ncbi:hypothetical protein ACFVXE_01445 [Streptomyces sp. NPDC058231]|uniref:hypothetical protein n=1 Tax=unclassified Streptomyces TaxID=2593676 RepID=UPI0036E4B96A
MAKQKLARCAAGVAVSAVSAGACYRVWASGREWAQDVSRADPDTMFAGSLESLLATAAGLLLMPVLLWAGMRLLRQRGNHLFVLGGAVAWAFVGGHVVESAVGTGATAGFLALFALLGGLLALVRTPG